MAAHPARPSHRGHAGPAAQPALRNRARRRRRVRRFRPRGSAGGGGRHAGPPPVQLDGPHPADQGPRSSRRHAGARPPRRDPARWGRDSRAGPRPRPRERHHRRAHLRHERDLRRLRLRRRAARRGTRARRRDSRVCSAGATLASGYRNLPEHPAFAEPGWFRTDDAARSTTGSCASWDGSTRPSRPVDSPWSRRWSRPYSSSTRPFGRSRWWVCPTPGSVSASRPVVVPVPGATPTLAELRDHVEATLDPTAAPRELQVVDALPLRGPGKVDRRALVSRFS